MMEFILSRLTMSICALILMLTLAPVLCGLPWSAEPSTSSDTLDRLASVFREVENAPGEALVKLELSDYPIQEEERLLLRKGSIWLIGQGHEEARSVPQGYQILLRQGSGETVVEQAWLDGNALLTLSKTISGEGESLEAHIENFEATSDTRSANPSTSSMVL
jgi:hypothetical protein